MKKIILLIPFLLFAFVKVHVNKKRIYPGEEVVFTIEATGNKIEFPKIDNIAGFNVQGSAVTQNITILNGTMQKTVSKSYIFFPDKSLIIPAFKVKVDGKVFTTEPIPIKISKPSQSKDKNFKIELSVNKKNVHLEEPVIFKISFYQNENTNPQSIEIQKPNFKNFFTKLLSKKERKKDGFVITDYTFLLIPQKTGLYKIGPILGKIGYLDKESPFNDPFFNLMTSTLKYKNIFSNSVDLNVTEIPSDTVYGKFKAELKADKTEARSQEPVKIVLNIKGCGDFYDLPNFKLNIPDATVYENAPKIETYVKNGNLCGTYTKEFTVVSEHSFKVPHISFYGFYDSKTEKVTTNSIYVKIKGGKIIHKNTAKEPLKVEKIVYKQKDNYLLSGILFLLGAIVGFLLAKITEMKKNDDKSNIYKKIKKANDKDLFNILLEYSYDPDIEHYLKLLEENIYGGKKHKINKKEIIKIIKKIKK